MGIGGVKVEDRFKFRVFISDKKNSKNSLTGMFKVHSLHTGTNKAIITSLYGNCSIKLENNVLMQCTGLKDKNGKLIYEGDVVKETLTDFINKEIITVVKWDKLNASYNFENLQNCEREVIGNIYENPELLED
jgi:uncharacterized phage protein (TIGR01671 family)